MTAIFISFIIITLINVLAYIWAYKNQSDHLTDISYSLCFILVTTYFLFAYQALSWPRLIFAGLVVLWAIRLGGFLFYRIHKMGRDTRFDQFRSSSSGFLKFWLLQSVSICIISLPVLVGLSADGLVIHKTAVLVWTFGWVLEAVADLQKLQFKNRHPNEEFIASGVYTYLRHPNYLGEILIWTGIFLYVTPILEGWLWVSIMSPIWLIFLLVKVSGIPLIEAANLKKHKDGAAYQQYLKRTWRLIPFIY